MNIYLICPVRNTTLDFSELVEGLEKSGHSVHFPARDVDQSDPVGLGICAAHLAALKLADAVYIIWDNTSYGSHFDLGMAFALGKPIKLLQAINPDSPGKSYHKVIEALQ